MQETSPPQSTSSQSEPARVFRVSPWVLGIILVGMLISFGGTWLMYRQGGFSARFWVSAALAIFFIAGMADALVSRIVLDHDALHVIELLSRRSYARSEILEVKFEKGAGIALKMVSNAWVKLPDLANVHHNTIRAWVKRGR
jgi:hypothetical protein